MKRMIVTTMLFFATITFAAAQTATGNGSRNTAAASSTANNKKSKGTLKPSDTLNNRKIYHFKNGQRATPTGHEATPSSIGGGYAAIGRDKTPAPRKAKTKAAARRSN